MESCKCNLLQVKITWCTVESCKCNLLQGEDYLVYRGAGFDYNFGVFVREEHGGFIGGDNQVGARVLPGGRKGGEQPDSVRVIQGTNSAANGGVPVGGETKLPGLNITAKDGAWQLVSGTR